MNTRTYTGRHASAPTQEAISIAITRNEDGLIQYGQPQHVDADIVIPVYNEEEQLAASVLTLRDYLISQRYASARFTWNIVIADNASTDSTWDIAQQLSNENPGIVRAVHIERKGRGYALKQTWGESLAQVVSYMDVDLSTDIACTGTLIGSLLSGQADVAIGSRLLSDSNVTRSLKREFISRTYNLMLRTYLQTNFHDAQCGFKAMTAAAASMILPKTEDNEWFFDTEMLVRAHMRGLRLYEIPVRWIEDAGTTVNIPDTVSKDLTGMRRMKHEIRATANTVDTQRYRLSSAYSSIGWDTQGQGELRVSLIELAARRA